MKEISGLDSPKNTNLATRTNKQSLDNEKYRFIAHSRKFRS